MVNSPILYNESCRVLSFLGREDIQLQYDNESITLTCDNLSDVSSKVNAYCQNKKVSLWSTSVVEKPDHVYIFIVVSHDPDAI